MQDNLFQQKQPGHIKLGGYAIVPSAPGHINFGDHGLPLRNATEDADFVTGAYGTSVNAALFMATEHARMTRMQSIRVMLHFQVRGGMPKTGAIDRDYARRTGFLHTGRLERGFRAEVLELLLDHLCSTKSRRLREFERASLRDVLLAHPDLAYVLLREDPMLDVVVHPATLTYKSKMAEKVIYVATVRAARAAEMNAQVVHLESQFSASGGRSC